MCVWFPSCCYEHKAEGALSDVRIHIYCDNSSGGPTPTDEKQLP